MLVKALLYLITTFFLEQSYTSDDRHPIQEVLLGTPGTQIPDSSTFLSSNSILVVLITSMSPSPVSEVDVQFALQQAIAVFDKKYDKEFESFQAECTAVLSDALKNTSKYLDDALKPIVENQNNIEKKTNEQFSRLEQTLNSMASQVYSTTHLNLSTNTQSLNLSTSTPSSSSPKMRTLSKAELSASSRTLGFYPLRDSLLTCPPPSDVTQLRSELVLFLTENLQLSGPSLSLIEPKYVWLDLEKKMLFAEFYSFNMCQIIFNHMTNLKRDQRVSKYIHPSLVPQFHDLTNQAFHLRHDQGLQTRIDYGTDGLLLLSKKPSQISWELVCKHMPSEESPADDLIPQVDGNDSIASLDSTPSVAANLRRADYTLNKNKQLNRLAKNATIPNFTIDINSSTNATIQCSSGFYQLVAKPVLSSLLQPYFLVSSTPIYCSDSLSPKLDQLNRNVNVVLHFKVGDNESQESATVHLHHTQQKVQVQGLAATWFVKHVLKNKFASGAHEHELNIRILNSNMSKSADELSGPGHRDTKTCSQTVCPHCKTKFRSNSKLLNCGYCSQKFHDSKQNPCLQRHYCPRSVSTTAVSASNPTAVTFSVASSSSRPSVVSITTLSTPVISSQEINPCRAVSPRTSMSVNTSVALSNDSRQYMYPEPPPTTCHSFARPQTSSTTSFSPLPSVLPTLAPTNTPRQPDSSKDMDPAAAPFIPSSISHSSHAQSSAKLSESRNKNKKSVASKDPKEVENDFLKRETLPKFIYLGLSLKLRK